MKLSNITGRTPLLLWQLFLLLTVANPDVYLGLADIWFLPLLICFYGMFRKKTFVDNDTIQYHYGLLIYLILPTLISLIGYGIVSTGYLFSYALWILLHIATLNLNFTQKEIKKLLSAYIISGAIMGFLILYQRLDYYDSIYASRYTIQILGHERFDPNFLAACMVIPFILSITKQLFNYSLWNLVCLILIFLGVLFTASRGAMLSCSIGATTAFSIFAFRRRKVKYLIWGGFLVVILGYTVLNILPEASFERLFSKSYDDSSNEKRFVDWAVGFKAFENSWLFGYGMQGEMQIIKREVGVSMIAHNTYLAFLLQFGVIGFSVLAIGVMRLIKKTLLYKEYLVTAMVISTLFVVFFISGEVAVFLWVPLITASLVLQIKENNEVSSITDLL